MVSPTTPPTRTPSDIPNVQPTKNPSGNTWKPSTTPYYKPTTSPATLTPEECKTLLVYPGLCKNTFGANFVYAVDSSNSMSSAEYGQVQDFFLKITGEDPEYIPDPQSSPGSSLGNLLKGNIKTFERVCTIIFFNTFVDVQKLLW